MTDSMLVDSLIIHEIDGRYDSWLVEGVTDVKEARQFLKESFLGYVSDEDQDAYLASLETAKVIAKKNWFWKPINGSRYDDAELSSLDDEPNRTNVKAFPGVLFQNIK
jgi:hypothetical protein